MDVVSKSTLREKILNLLKSQKEEDKLRKSKIIQDKLFAAPEFQKAQVVLFYASFNGEVDTFDMMKQAKKIGKQIALPTIIKDQKRIVPSFVEDLDAELTDGPYGIKQPKQEYLRPVDCQKIDLVLVPGVAFDKYNNRLGRGGGYYDRFLEELSCEKPRFGLAFDFQVLDRLPHPEEHDQTVSRVLTN
ncbi:MAG: 5-formyltetrahydrofolate cyclo-ligase [Candidatus Omnitrophota bacterium]